MVHLSTILASTEAVGLINIVRRNPIIYNNICLEIECVCVSIECKLASFAHIHNILMHIDMTPC